MKIGQIITITSSGCMAVLFCGMTMAEVPQASAHRKSKPAETTTEPVKQPRPAREAKKSGPKKAELTSPTAKRSERVPDSNLQPVKEDSSEESPKSRKTARHNKKSKKAKLQAVADPRKDLMYHGILEGPSRYEPRRDYPTAGPPDPQTSELTYEHFQELDRNGDGSIDPVERAFGRLDMDHDLSKRQR